MSVSGPEGQKYYRHTFLWRHSRFDIVHCVMDLHVRSCWASIWPKRKLHCALEVLFKEVKWGSHTLPEALKLFRISKNVVQPDPKFCFR